MAAQDTGDKETLVETPQTGNNITEQEQEIAEVSAEINAIDNLVPQKTKAEEALVQTPQARGEVSTPRRLPSAVAPMSSNQILATKKVEAEGVLAKSPQAGGNVIKIPQDRESESFTREQ